MTQAYTPGLLVSPDTWWQCRRVLPIAGEVLVNEGDVIEAEQVVAQAELPGDAYPVNLAKQLGITSSQMPGSLLKSIGDVVQQGDVLARSPGIFGWFRNEFVSPVTGVLESVSSLTGLAILRGAPRKIQVKAYLAGEVTQRLADEGVVIEAKAAVIQGIFGIGGEAYGTIQLASDKIDEDLTAERVLSSHRGAILVGGRRVTKEAVDRAREFGVAALVAGGIDDQDLKDILGYDLGVAVTGMEQLGLTIIITEGFGEIAMAGRTFELFSQLQGQRASVNGTTQIRAGVLRPEIVVPRPSQAKPATTVEETSGALAKGVAIRVIREPYFGELGIVSELPSEPQLLESQSKARVAVVRLYRGDEVTVPRANLERIEGAAE